MLDDDDDDDDSTQKKVAEDGSSWNSSFVMEEEKQQEWKWYMRFALVSFLALIGVSVYIALSFVVNYSKDHSGALSLTVETTNGPVQGFAYISNSTLVNMQGFRGIPFAKPPVGDLRWMAPQPQHPFLEATPPEDRDDQWEG